MKLTLIAALLLMSFVVLCFLIGWLLTGKFILRGRGCGMRLKEKNSLNESGCDLCHSNKCLKEKE